MPCIVFALNTRFMAYHCMPPNRGWNRKHHLIWTARQPVANTCEDFKSTALSPLAQEP